MFAVVVVLLNALSFASLAYVANRKGQHTMAALLAAGAWLFGVTGVLVWFWRLCPAASRKLVSRDGEYGHRTVAILRFVQ